MKLNYYSDTDSLYIDLSEQPSVESREISEGIVLDYDVAGNLVEIDIDNASRKVETSRSSLSTNFRPSSRTTQPNQKFVDQGEPKENPFVVSVSNHER